MTSTADQRWMKAALSLGRRGLGQCAPNPAVGCVLVRPDLGDRLVGRGWTQPGGRPHAEVRALQQAGDLARGATAYVTLEPCAHYGKTPPCAEALIAAGVTRVVCALRDPDPRVDGGGFDMLSAAGIEVVEDVMAAEAAFDNAGFLKRVTDGRPMVTLKLASSLDGRIATKTGDSRWITGPASRRQVHLMRATHDLVMVGASTALADNPDLSVRGLGMADRTPVRMVLDSQLRSDPGGRLGQSAETSPVWLAHSGAAADRQEAWRATGAELIDLPHGDAGLDLQALMAELGQRGITRMFCEGGGTLAANLLSEQLVDRLITFHAGVAIGGDGTPSLAGFGIEALSDAPRFTAHSSQVFGPDRMTVWVRKAG